MLLLLLHSLLSLGRKDDVVVETPLGKVRGFKMTSRSGQEFSAFRGIPYAKPPIGQLRFQPPVAVDPWKDILLANKEKSYCIQSNIFEPTHSVVGEEDCLYLSVYTRNISGNASVLVHIHGGAHSSGGSAITRPNYLMDEEIVVVDINFRIGIFGFLSFEDKILPGNQGMKDQVQALKWVQQNIASFGGNPKLVTIIGESSGAGSVCHHLASPLSKGLFHRAIAQSGSSSAPWNLAPPGFAKSRAEKLMTLINCPTNPTDAIPCATKIDANVIASNFSKLLEWQIDPVVNFGPVIEPSSPDAFLGGSISAWVQEPVPLMLGLNSGEGLLRTVIMNMHNTDFKWYSENFNRLAPVSLMYSASASNPDEITSKIRQFYFPESTTITMNDWTNLTNMYSDGWFTLGSIDQANSHPGDVYFYYFDVIMQGISVFPLTPEINSGAFHCSDMALIWNLSLPMVPNVSNEEEKLLSEQFIKLVTSFMEQGHPTSEEDKIKWKKWTSNDKNYLHITQGGYHMKKNLLEDRYNFWKTLNIRDKFLSHA